jgi:hypothetical protein
MRGSHLCRCASSTTIGRAGVVIRKPCTARARATRSSQRSLAKSVRARRQRYLPSCHPNRSKPCEKCYRMPLCIRMPGSWCGPRSRHPAGGLVVVVAAGTSDLAVAREAQLVAGLVRAPVVGRTHVRWLRRILWWYCRTAHNAQLVRTRCGGGQQRQWLRRGPPRGTDRGAAASGINDSVLYVSRSGRSAAASASAANVGVRASYASSKIGSSRA